LQAREAETLTCFGISGAARHRPFLGALQIDGFIDKDKFKNRLMNRFRSFIQTEDSRTRHRRAMLTGIGNHLEQRRNPKTDVRKGRGGQ